MAITQIPGADEKNAKLSLKLRADSGYNATSDGNRVSANQWAAIISICEETATGRAIMAAPEVLTALTDLLAATERHVFGDECLAEREAARAAITKATQSPNTQVKP